MLIEFHILQNHAPSNLNRDDTGSPKECMFGGHKRARISSQCLKRSMRTSEIFQTALEGHLGTRTRKLPEIVKNQLIEQGVSPDIAEIAAKKATGFGTDAGTELDADKKSGLFLTRQTMLLTDSDVNAVVDVMQAAIKAAGNAAKFEKVTAKDLQAQAQPKGFRPISVDVALFGRMITSQAFRNVDAACQVAHALSTNTAQPEYDFFTAVDDLQGIGEEEEDAGADMIGEVEFNSACYYKYISLDVTGLVRNLLGEDIPGRRASEADKKDAALLAGVAAEALLKAVVLTTPTGKQNTFAAHQLPSTVLVEIRPRRTPVSYANAFVEPAKAGKGEDLVQDSMRMLAEHVTLLSKGFNLVSQERLLLAPLHGGYQIDGVEKVADLNALCARIREVATHG